MSKKVLILLSGLLMFSMLLTSCQPAATPIVTEVPEVAVEVPAEPEEPEAVYRLAAIFPGVITDADYNTLAYVGISELTRDTGIETAYSESVPVPDVERVMREYIDAGYNIIWTHGGQFVNKTAEVAPQFPGVVFIAEGDAPLENPPANLWFIDRNFQVGFYGIGATAALSTKTGKIGYLGGQTLPFSYAEVHAIQQAIADLGLTDTVEFTPVWTGDFNDPTKARQLADALIADGVDVIMCAVNLGVFGAFEAVKAVPDKQVLITVKYIDKSSFAPLNYVTALLYDFAGPLKEIYANILAGEMGGYYPLGFDTGVALQMPLKNVDPAVETQVTEILGKIQDGTITVVKDTSEVK
jgi:basic membrane protein A